MNKPFILWKGKIDSNIAACADLATFVDCQYRIVIDQHDCYFIEKLGQDKLGSPIWEDITDKAQPELNNAVLTQCIYDELLPLAKSKIGEAQRREQQRWDYK